MKRARIACTISKRGWGYGRRRRGRKEKKRDMKCSDHAIQQIGFSLCRFHSFPHTLSVDESVYLFVCFQNRKLEYALIALDCHTNLYIG